MKFPQDGKTMKKLLSTKHKVVKKWPPKKPANDNDADDMPVKKSKKKVMKKASGPIKHTGKFGGKSNQLGQGGRAAQMRARGVPGGVIGNIARSEQAAPGQANFHKRKK